MTVPAQVTHWKTVPGGVELAMVGPVDHDDAPSLADDLDALIGMPGVDLVLVDMGRVPTLDRSGIDALLAAKQRAASVGVTVAIGYLPDTVRQALAMAGALETLAGT